MKATIKRPDGTTISVDGATAEDVEKLAGGSGITAPRRTTGIYARAVGTFIEQKPFRAALYEMGSACWLTGKDARRLA